MTFGRTARAAGCHGSASQKPASAVVLRGVPAGERVDRDARARVRRVDEPASTDVDPDVAEPVEEDEVARAQARARDAPAEAVLAARPMRQNDPEVRVDEAREPGAVEAARR